MQESTEHIINSMYTTLIVTFNIITPKVKEESECNHM